MGKIIQIKNYNEPHDKKTREKVNWKRIIAGLCTFCTITGITVIGLIGHFLERDWKKVVEAYNDQGIEQFNLENYEEAIALYNKAIKLENKGVSDMGSCYYNRGRAYFKLGQYQQAISDYTRAIEIDPKPAYYSERAVTYELIGETEKASLDNMRVILGVFE